MLTGCDPLLTALSRPPLPLRSPCGFIVFFSLCLSFLTSAVARRFFLTYLLFPIDPCSCASAFSLLPSHTLFSPPNSSSLFHNDPTPSLPPLGFANLPTHGILTCYDHVRPLLFSVSSSLASLPCGVAREIKCWPSCQNAEFRFVPVDCLC